MARETINIPSVVIGGRVYISQEAVKFFLEHYEENLSKTAREFTEANLGEYATMVSVALLTVQETRKRLCQPVKYEKP